MKTLFIKPLHYLAVVGAIVAFNNVPAMAQEFVNEIAVVECLQRADWTKLATLVSSTSSNAQEPCLYEPHLRFLAGHAFLATGKNNTATLLFACASDTSNSPTLIAWQDWTKALVRRHPTWPSARYLYADALARLGFMKEAAVELDQAIALNPNDFMARNARGVVRWILGVQDSTSTALKYAAEQDFEIATQRPEFADAWANRGVLALYDGLHPETMKMNFDEALKRDKTFAMAFNGLSSVAGAMGKLDEVKRNLIIADSLYPRLPFVVSNTAAVTDSTDTTSYLARIVREQSKDKVRGFSSSFSLGGFLGKTFGFGTDLNAYLKQQSTITTWNQRDPSGITMGYEKILKTERGGLYVFINENENFLVDRERGSRAIGTWFVLGYSMPITYVDLKGGGTQ